MTAPAAIEADFAAIKFVQGRKVAQLVMEIPIEAADHALAVLGGVPLPDQSRPVAVARLQEADETEGEPENGRNSEADALAQDAADPLHYQKQAGMRCQERDFHRFLAAEFGVSFPQNGDHKLIAADRVRRICGVQSRKEFDSDPDDAGARWRTLVTQYDEWRGRV